MPLTPAWKQFRFHPTQTAFYRSPARFKIALAGRGSGKTDIARRRVVRALAERKPWPDPKYFYALPTLPQAKKIAWDDIIALIPPEWLAGDPNISEMRIRTKFGSALYVLGMDKPHRAEGVQWDGGVLDECSDQRPGVFPKTFMPALTHRNGWCMRIGRPNRNGIGFREFRKAFESGAQGVESFTWSSEDILTGDQLAELRNQLDPLEYDEQIKALLLDPGGTVYHSFTRANVMPWKYRPDLPIFVGSDFNIDPMSWVLVQEWEGKSYCFDEIFERNCNTQRALTLLHSKYREHKTGWKFYGDASARARKTSATISDYLQILNDSRFQPKEVHYLQSNPRKRDRFATTNAALCNANGILSLFIDPRCRYLIEDMESRAYAEFTTEVNDAELQGHIADALDYYVYMRRPLRLLMGGVPKISIG